MIDLEKLGLLDSPEFLKAIPECKVIVSCISLLKLVGKVNFENDEWLMASAYKAKDYAREVELYLEAKNNE